MPPAKKTLANKTIETPKKVAASEDMLSAIKKRLHTSFIPDQLPCRDAEYEDIDSFLRSKLREGVGGCLYISGVPGTGKTATVCEVVKTLIDESKKSRKSKGRDAIPSFVYIEVNGLRLTDPYHVYSEIYEKLTGRKVSAKVAADYLDDYFKPNVNDDEEDDKFIVLLVDELDVLCTKKQKILYHLFDWPNRQNSRLVVVAIANAMDLPERVLISRVASRLGLTRITFHGYNHEQLQEIIESRLEKHQNIFDKTAITLVAKKVCNVSGDARRALDICRHALGIAEMRCKNDGRKDLTVNVSDVHKVLEEIFSSSKIAAIRECSKQEQLFLRAISCEFESSGLEEASFTKVVRYHQDLCRLDGHQVPTTSQLMNLAFNLYERRLILLDFMTTSTFLKSKIRLNISTDDIDFALKPDKEV